MILEEGIKLPGLEALGDERNKRGVSKRLRNHEGLHIAETAQLCPRNLLYSQHLGVMCGL